MSDHKRMTVAHALRILLDLDNQIVCPRPSVFGEMAHLLANMAIELGGHVTDDGDQVINYGRKITHEDFGDVSGLAEPGHWPLPADAEKTWRLDS